ncbi:hypothetical protein [Streptomyces sp. NPDC059781]|uniref:hypothetical protein n=1 Tax=Streptomyces sp. NPDC059781 TaxID=3346943 RepID=UPI00365212EB
MQIKPRQHLLDIWRVMARRSFDKGSIVRENADGLNSAADTEPLLIAFARALPVLWELDTLPQAWGVVAQEV